MHEVPRFELRMKFPDLKGMEKGTKDYLCHKCLKSGHTARQCNSYVDNVMMKANGTDEGFRTYEESKELFMEGASMNL